MEVKVSLSGEDAASIEAKIKAKLDEIRQNAAVALFEGGELMATAIKDEAPTKSGAMKGSVSVDQLSDTEVQVGPHVFYAPLVEFGHGNWSGDPFMKRGVEKSRNDVAEYIKSRLTEK
jgi:HK97 gp10 family phage protein